jgi:sugar phosphate isomerase/epimerase
MTKFKIAAQLYTVRDFLKTDSQVFDTFKRIKAAGYNAVQVSGLGEVKFETIKEASEREGLTICATHIGFERLKNDIESVIKQHKLWNCNYVGIGSMPGEYRKDRDGYIRFAKEASEFGKVLLNSGLQLIYHNHNFEFIKFDGVTGMEILMNESDKDAFHFEIDTFWVQSGGGNPVEWIEKMRSRMKVVHFKDMAINDEGKPVMAEIGEGNLSWKNIIESCDKIGVEWAAVEQDICVRSPFDCLETSLVNLKSLGCDY